jgi:hypothetical protein
MIESSVKSISRPVIDRLPVTSLDFACRQLDRVRSILIPHRFAFLYVHIGSVCIKVVLISPPISRLARALWRWHATTTER